LTPGYAREVDEVTDATFADEVLASPVPVVVDFWAPWCRPCEAIEPHLVGIAEEHGDRIRLVRVNVDENLAVSGRYGILSLPTVILFSGGEARATVHGAQGRARYEKAFAPVFGA
jgi:thioredoxin 1